MLPEMANRESLDCFALFCCRDFLFTGFAVETAAFSSGPVSTSYRVSVCGFRTVRKNRYLKLITSCKQVKLGYFHA